MNYSYYRLQRNWCKVMFLPPANEVWDKVIFLYLSVILFTGGKGYLGRYPCPPGPSSTRDQVHLPGTRYTTLGPGTPSPQDQVPPPRELCMLGDTGNKRAVRILLECNLVNYYVFTIRQRNICKETKSDL